MISANSPVRTRPPPSSLGPSSPLAPIPPSDCRTGRGGSELYRALKIFIYKNGDPHFQGRKIVVSTKRFKNFEQLLSTLTTDVKLHSGAVRRLYDLQGHRVQSISDLTNQSHYVASGNEPFRNTDYPLIKIGQEKPKLHRGKFLSVDTDNSKSVSIKSLRKDGVPFNNNKHRAIRIAIFINGDVNTPPQKMVLSHRNCRSFDQFFSDATLLVRLKEGRIRRFYDAQTGKPVQSLLDLKDGQNLLASGTNAPMQKLMYPFLDFAATTDVRRLSWLSREINTLITVYPNGDVLHTGVKVTVNPYRFRDLKSLLTFLDHEIPLYTGRAGQLFTLTGTKVTDMGMLENNGHYAVAAVMDPFIKGNYNSDSYHKSTVQGSVPSPKNPEEAMPKPMVSQTHHVDLTLKRKKDGNLHPSLSLLSSNLTIGQQHSPGAKAGIESRTPS